MKKLLIFGLAMGLAGGLTAGNAFAAPVDLDDPTAPIYASELEVDATDGLDLDVTGGAGDELDVEFELNPNAVPAGTDVRVTLELSNGATFVTAPVAADIIDTDLAAQEFGILTGGADSSSVTFTGNTGAGFAAGQTFSVTVADINVVDNGDVAMSVTVAVADNFGTTTLKTISSAEYVDFEPALELIITAQEDADLIDVSQEALFFDDAEGDVNITLGTVELDFTALLDATSTALVNANDILADVDFQLTVPNGLAAFDQDGASCLLRGQSLTIDGTTASLEAETASLYDTARSVICSVPADNAVTIDPSAVTLGVAGNANADFTATTSTGSGALASLVKNGATELENLALTPGGAYSNFVRITNTSGIAGTIFLKLYQDDGTASAQFGLADVDATVAADLDAQASTKLLNINDIYAASGLSEGYTGKLRLEVEGEVPSLDVQMITVTTDGTGFSTF